MESPNLPRYTFHAAGVVVEVPAAPGPRRVDICRSADHVFPDQMDGHEAVLLRATVGDDTVLAGRAYAKFDANKRTVELVDLDDDGGRLLAAVVWELLRGVPRESRTCELVASLVGTLLGPMRLRPDRDVAARQLPVLDLTPVKTPWSLDPRSFDTSYLMPEASGAGMAKGATASLSSVVADLRPGDLAMAYAAATAHSRNMRSANARVPHHTQVAMTRRPCKTAHAKSPGAPAPQASTWLAILSPGDAVPGLADVEIASRGEVALRGVLSADDATSRVAAEVARVELHAAIRRVEEARRNHRPYGKTSLRDSFLAFVFFRYFAIEGASVSPGTYVRQDLARFSAALLGCIDGEEIRWDPWGSGFSVELTPGGWIHFDCKADDSDLDSYVASINRQVAKLCASYAHLA